MTAPLNDRYEDALGMSLSAEDQYERDIAWIRLDPLTEEEETRLFAKMIRAACEPDNQWRASVAKQARDRIVEAYQPIVFFVARKVARQVKDIEVLDAVGEGNIGLLVAIDDYVAKPSRRQKPFKALAITCIRHEIWQARYVRGGLVAASYDQVCLLSRLRRVTSQFSAEYGYDPSIADLASLLDLSEEKVEDLQSLSQGRQVQSLHQYVPDDQDDPFRSLKMVPLFEGTSTTVQEVQSSPLLEALREAIRCLTPRQREVITQYYGLSDELGSGASVHAVIAESLGIEVRHLRGYEKTAREKLRHFLMHFFDEQGNMHTSWEPSYDIKEVQGLLGMSLGGVMHRVSTGMLPAKAIRSIYGSRVKEYRVPKWAVDALVSDREEVSA